jgi:hypothetical protein
VTFAEIRTARLDLWLEHGPTARAYLAEAVERTDIKLPFKLPKNFPDAKTLAQVGANHLMKHFGFPPDGFHRSRSEQKRKCEYKLEDTAEHKGTILKLSEMYDRLYHCVIPLWAIDLGHFDALAVFSKRQIAEVQKRLKSRIKGSAWFCLELGEDCLKPHVHVICGPQSSKIKRSFKIKVYDSNGICHYLSKGFSPDLEFGKLRLGKQPDLKKLVTALVLIGFQLEIKRRLNPKSFGDDGQPTKRRNLPRKSWGQEIPRAKRKQKPTPACSMVNVSSVFVNEKQPIFTTGNAPQAFTTATAAAHASETALARAQTEQTTMPFTLDLLPELVLEEAWAAAGLEVGACSAAHVHDLSEFRQNTRRANTIRQTPIRTATDAIDVRSKGRGHDAPPTGIKERSLEFNDDPGGLWRVNADPATVNVTAIIQTLQTRGSLAAAG